MPNNIQTPNRYRANIDTPNKIQTPNKYIESAEYVQLIKIIYICII